MRNLASILFMTTIAMLHCNSTVKDKILNYESPEEIQSKAIACRSFLQGDKRQLEILLPELDPDERLKIARDDLIDLPLPKFIFEPSLQRGVVYLPEHWGDKFGVKRVKYSEFIAYHCLVFISTHVNSRLQ